MKQIILDVETKRSFDEVGGYYPEKLGVSFVGAIQRSGLPEKGRVEETAHELFEDDLDRLWPLLETADVIVGFNTIGFDLPTFKPYYSGDLEALPNLDLLVRVKDSTGHRVRLDDIAKSTLGTQKSGHGLDAIAYYQNQEWNKLAKYCMQDVKITRDIYDFGRQKGFVKFKNKWNTVLEVKVDFTFTPKDPNVQMTLV